MPTQISGNFDVSTKPELFLQLPTVARVFHRRDLEPARTWQTYPILPEPKIPVPLALLHGIRRRLGGGRPEPAGELPAPWVSDTGQLTWDPGQGLVLIQTPNTQAAIGQMGPRPIQLRDVTFSVTMPFACLLVTSLDDQPLDRSTHLLLTAVARSENAGTVYNATRTLLRASGTSPILMEPVVGSMSFAQGARRVNPQVFALDVSGSRLEMVSTRTTNGVLEVPLGQAHAYELVFEEAR